MKSILQIYETIDGEPDNTKGPSYAKDLNRDSENTRKWKSRAIEYKNEARKKKEESENWPIEATKETGRDIVKIAKGAVNMGKEAVEKIKDVKHRETKKMFQRESERATNIAQAAKEGKVPNDPSILTRVTNTVDDFNKNNPNVLKYAGAGAGAAALGGLGYLAYKKYKQKKASK